MAKDYSAITPDILKLSELCSGNSVINSEMYLEHKVFRGLRDLNGNGVLTGLTEVSDIQSFEIGEDGEKHPCRGRLFYRGINVEELVGGFIKDNRFGFEETTYLLLFGDLPNREELDSFTRILSGYRTLPGSFVRDIIMKAPSHDMMNTLARSVLTLYAYDNRANDTSIPNVLRQCLQLIALFPLLSVYGYQAYDYYLNDGTSFFIHEPRPELSTAQNILHMLRIDSKYTELEARILDIALILHAEHGGGNNSTFTTRVVSSSGTDTYSAIAAALGSLKGPKHGGANIKVVQMMENIKENIKDWTDEEEITAYLAAILNKEAFDRSGLIYGMGHAVYSLSDPRAEIFKRFVKKLSDEKGMQKALSQDHTIIFKGMQKEYTLYSNVERLAPHVIEHARKMYKGVSANIDFYSGFVYNMLGLPLELYTPIFAMARISGWSAHRIEELVNAGKIIRPSYKCVQPRRDYKPLSER